VGNTGEGTTGRVAQGGQHRKATEGGQRREVSRGRSTEGGQHREQSHAQQQRNERAASTAPLPLALAAMNAGEGSSPQSLRLGDCTINNVVLALLLH
jgi:hypothetical protein